jgi:hypothetical protein
VANIYVNTITINNQHTNNNNRNSHSQLSSNCKQPTNQIVLKTRNYNGCKRTHTKIRVTLCPSIVNVLTNIWNHPFYYSTLLIPYIHLLAHVLIPVICPCYHHASPPSCFPLPYIKTAWTKTAQITSLHQNHNKYTLYHIISLLCLCSLSGGK